MLATFPSVTKGFLNIISHTLHLIVLGAFGNNLTTALTLSIRVRLLFGILNLSNTMQATIALLREDPDSSTRTLHCLLPFFRGHHS